MKLSWLLTRLRSITDLFKKRSKAKDSTLNDFLVYDVTERVFSFLSPEAKTKSNTWYHTHVAVDADNRPVEMGYVSVSLNHFPKDKDMREYAKNISSLKGLSGFMTRVFVSRIDGNKYSMYCHPMILSENKKDE